MSVICSSPQQSCGVYDKNQRRKGGRFLKKKWQEGRGALATNGPPVVCFLAGEVGNASTAIFGSKPNKFVSDHHT